MRLTQIFQKRAFNPYFQKNVQKAEKLHLTQLTEKSSGLPVWHLYLPNPNPGGKPPGPPVWYLNLPNPNPNLIRINYTKYKTKFL